MQFYLCLNTEFFYIKNSPSKNRAFLLKQPLRHRTIVLTNIRGDKNRMCPEAIEETPDISFSGGHPSKRRLSWSVTAMFAHWTYSCSRQGGWKCSTSLFFPECYCQLKNVLEEGEENAFERTEMLRYFGVGSGSFWRVIRLQRRLAQSEFWSRIHINFNTIVPRYWYLCLRPSFIELDSFIAMRPPGTFCSKLSAGDLSTRVTILLHWIYLWSNEELLPGVFTN